MTGPTDFEVERPNTHTIERGHQFTFRGWIADILVGGRDGHFERWKNVGDFIILVGCGVVMEELQEITMEVDIRHHVNIQNDEVFTVTVGSADIAEEVAWIRCGHRVVIGLFVLLAVRSGKTIDQKRKTSQSP